MKAKFQTLKNVLETEFEHKLFDAALFNLMQKDNNLRHCNFAYAFRELLDIILKRLAPNETVIKCPWYKRESSKYEVTRGQRLRYIVQGNWHDFFIDEIIQLDTFRENLTELNKKHSELSEFTHINEQVFNYTDKEITAFIREFEEIMNCFFEELENIKDNFLEITEYCLRETINDCFIADTITEIDEIATHYLIEHVEAHEIDVELNTEDIDICANGTVYVEHQYGSNSDIKNDIGCYMNEDYPFDVKFKVNILDINEVLVNNLQGNLQNISKAKKKKVKELFFNRFSKNIELVELNVDTSKFFR